MAEPVAQSLRAPAKLNLGLRLGPADGSGLHAIRSLLCPLELSDRIVVAGAETDEVVCPAVEGRNLAAAALEALRAAGWDAPPVRIEIEKRIPIAAGLGGGSADAAAVLRIAGASVQGLTEIAFALGSDVPSQLEPAPAIVGGRGEQVDPVTLQGAAGVVLIPAANGLTSAEVYAKADEIGLPVSAAELDLWERQMRAALRTADVPTESGALLANDLEPAARALMPEIGEALDALEAAGAAAAFVCGSGPTVAGLFADLPAADAAARAVGLRRPGALVTALDPRPVL